MNHIHLGTVALIILVIVALFFLFLPRSTMTPVEEERSMKPIGTSPLLNEGAKPVLRK